MSSKPYRRSGPQMVARKQSSWSLEDGILIRRDVLDGQEIVSTIKETGGPILPFYWWSIDMGKFISSGRCDSAEIAKNTVSQKLRKLGAKRPTDST